MVYFCFQNQEEYDQLRIMAYPNTNVFILCFSVVDPDSYSNILSKWIPELNRMFFSLSLSDIFLSIISKSKVIRLVFQLFLLEQKLIFVMTVQHSNN